MKKNNSHTILQKSFIRDSQKLPLISIVIPVYNREDFITEAIESALQQTYQNIEIVIVDNNSSDNTVKNTLNLVSGNNKVTVIKNFENFGPVLNWLKGVHLSKGRYTKLLFSDDILFPTCISKLYKGLNSDVGFCFSSCLVGNEKSKSKEMWRFLIGDNKYFSILLFLRYVVTRSYLVSPCAALFRKKDLIISLENSILNPICEKSFRTGAGPDLKIYLDMLQKYPLFAVVNDPQVFFRSHKFSFTIGKDSSLVKLGYKKTFEEVIRKSALPIKIISKLYYLYKFLGILKNCFIKILDRKKKNLN